MPVLFMKTRKKARFKLKFSKVSNVTNFFLNEPANEELHKVFDIVPNNEVTAITDLENEVSAKEKSIETVSTTKQGRLCIKRRLYIKMLENFAQKYSALKIDLMSCDVDDLAKILCLFFWLFEGNRGKRLCKGKPHFCNCRHRIT